MNLKILWITSVFPINQSDKRYLYLWDSINALQLLNVEIIVLVTKSWQPAFTGKIHSDFIFEKINQEEFPVPIKIIRYFSIPRHYFRSISNLSYLFRVVPVIKELVKYYQVNVIHAHGEIAGLAGIFVSKKLKIPSVITIHGVDTCYRKWKGLAGKMFCHMLNQASRIIFVGSSLQKHFQSIIDIDRRCHVIYNGVRLPTIQRNVDTSIRNNQIIRLISVSNLHEEKGIALTLKALTILKNREIRNWTYIIVGSGYQKKQLEKIILKHNLELHIQFVGACSHHAVYDHLQNAHVFCLPSYREAFGIVYLEAMVNGLLTIGVKDQGPQAFIENGKTGILVEPKSVDSLVEALFLAITQYKKMQEIINQGQQYASLNFTWKKHAEKLVKLYQEIAVQSS